MTLSINASETTVRQTAAAIGRAALFDDKITDGDAARLAAWAEALEPYKLAGADLLAAVTAYYQGNHNGRTIQVADLIRHGREIRRERAEREKAPDPTSPPNPALDGLPIPTEGKPVWAAYEVNDAIERPCPRCNAQPNEACINPINDHAQKIPCIARLTGRPLVR